MNGAPPSVNEDLLAREPSVIRRFLLDWFRWGALWTPVVVVLAQIVFSDAKDWTPTRLGLGFLVSLSISETVVLCCLGGSYLLATAQEAFFEWRGWEYREPSNLQHTVRSAMFVPVGLWLGFQFAAVVAAELGLEVFQPDFDSYKRGIVIGVFSMASYVAFDLYMTKRKSDVRLQALERETLLSRVSALSAQMNPHLLFNALNSVASTIPDDPKAAEEMTVELASLYRRVLEASTADSHSLHSEIEICRKYLSVEKSRFGDRLQYSVGEIPASLREVAIPTLIVQPFVENAVKHGISSLAEGGCIAVDVEDATSWLRIHVSDNGVGMGNSAKSGSGMAVENCRKRLQLIYGQRATVEVTALDPGTRMTITLARTGKGGSS